MTFILAEERDADVVTAFANYKSYLKENETHFPSSAFELANSDWFYNFDDHKCPHDAWLEKIEIIEPATGKNSENREVAIKIRLLGAYHDGYIELYYPKVFRYQFNVPAGDKGHGDWRYDEFRLSENGHLIHEIEWREYTNTSRWIIEASDIEYIWEPK